MHVSLDVAELLDEVDAESFDDLPPKVPAACAAAFTHAGWPLSNTPHHPVHKRAAHCPAGRQRTARPNDDDDDANPNDQRGRRAHRFALRQTKKATPTRRPPTGLVARVCTTRVATCRHMCGVPNGVVGGVVVDYFGREVERALGRFMRLEDGAEVVHGISDCGCTGQPAQASAACWSAVEVVVGEWVGFDGGESLSTRTRGPLARRSSELAEHCCATPDAPQIAHPAARGTAAHALADARTG